MHSAGSLMYFEFSCGIIHIISVTFLMCCISADLNLLRELPDDGRKCVETCSSSSSSIVAAAVKGSPLVYVVRTLVWF
jgi:hypothetical protein